ncbi:MAG: orotidine 5'-phosphate decarboxylase [Candidatus Hydrogenedentes bacterium]|nr:orotidine 5'-phosphate decarboxylase [Candidatus Hydrogenedentota bacterium]
MKSIIPVDRSIIPACDVSLERFEDLIRETCALDKIGAYKIGAALALTTGLPSLVETARKYTSKPLIYDHQKACTDIPDTGTEFVRAVKASGIDALIFFPLTGPATQTAWIQSARAEELSVIVGGHMTHERFLSRDGGYVDDQAVDKIFANAAYEGVVDYVVPGNKPDAIRHLKELLLSHRIDPVFYAPGFIAQGGNISDAALAAGARWHAIVGRAIYEAQDMQKAALSLASHL